MSWFSSFKESAAAMASSAAKVTESVEMLQKLTLTSPELLAEREQIDAEERRKESVREKLSALLPWETRDPERDILVEECRQVILKLSLDPETFMGPWEMPDVKIHVVPFEADAKDEEADNKARINESKTPTITTTSHNKPTAESLEKLDKLKPLPNLLENFDLDSHVGLIQRLLALDEHLVLAQSKFSGAGDRERIFWKNYFFHCAYSRYEAGLSVDEVWSEQDAQIRNSTMAGHKELDQHTALPTLASFQAAMGNFITMGTSAAKNAASATLGELDHLDHELEITFGDHGHEEVSHNPEGDETHNEISLGNESHETESNTEKAHHLVDAVDSKAATDLDHRKQQEYTAVSAATDYEMVDKSIPSSKAESKSTADDDDNVDYDDPELDELEAEIARELED